MDSDDIDEMERRFRIALAHAMRWAVQDQGWSRFRSAIAPAYLSDILAQNGMSPSGWSDAADAGDVDF